MRAITPKALGAVLILMIVDYVIDDWVIGTFPALYLEKIYTYKHRNKWYCGTVLTLVSTVPSWAQTVPLQGKGLCISHYITLVSSSASWFYEQ